MKRIILFLALVVSICLFSSCNNNTNNPCGYGYYYYNGQCFPITNNNNVGGVNAWANYTWVEHTAITTDQPLFMGYDADGNEYYMVSGCMMGPMGLYKNGIWIKGMYRANMIGLETNSSSAVRLNVFQTYLPLLKTQPWQFPGSYVPNTGTNLMVFMENGYEQLVGYHSTPCGP